MGRGLRPDLHHPAQDAAHHRRAGLGINYMFRRPGYPVRPGLIEEFVRHADPRVRNAGFRAAIEASDPKTNRSRRLFDLAFERLADEAESWWVKDACPALIARSTPDMIAPRVGELLSFLDHPEPWLQNGALTALMPVVTDERVYQEVLPPAGRLLRTTPRQSTTGGTIRARSPTDPDNQRILNDLGLQMDRGRLTLFLTEPEIGATNNRAERGLRPAAIARKVSHCSNNMVEIVAEALGLQGEGGGVAGVSADGGRHLLAIDRASGQAHTSPGQWPGSRQP